MRNLFSQPKYTIDTSSLLAMMNAGEKYDKEVFKKLWTDFQALCDAGKVVSHTEVHKEIKEGGVKIKLRGQRHTKESFKNIIFLGRKM